MQPERKREREKGAVIADQDKLARESMWECEVSMEKAAGERE